MNWAIMSAAIPIYGMYYVRKLFDWIIYLLWGVRSGGYRPGTASLLESLRYLVI